MPLRLLVRLQRTGVAAMSYVAIAYALVNTAVYPAFAGSTLAAQRAFGTQVAVLGGQLRWLLAAPVHPETAPGYLQWRGYGVFAIAFATWALLSAAGAARRDEERGLVDAWLTSGMSRWRLIVTRVVGFASCSAVAVTLAAVAGAVGCAVAGFAVPVSGFLGESAALWALSLASYGIVLLIAQQAPHFRSAAGTGGAVLGVLFLVDSWGRSAATRPALSEVSIFAQYGRSAAVAPGGAFDGGAVLILLAVAVVTTALAVVMFARRDLGAGVVTVRARGRPPGRLPSLNPMLRIAVLRGTWGHRVGFMAWTAVYMALAVFIVSLVGATYDLFTKSGALSGFLRGLHGDLHVVLFGLLWFAFAQVLIAVIAITHVSRWSADDGSGVLEVVLSQPVARWAVVLERGAELLVALAVPVFLSTLLILLVAPSQGLALPVGTLLLAAALLVPFGLTFGAAGAALAGWRPRVAVATLSVVVGTSYLLYEVAPLLHWPAWVADLSVFQLYGTPLSAPLFAGGLVAMLVIVVLGFALAMAALQRRDVAG